MGSLRSSDIHGASAVIYARYSSHSQRDASIEQQVAECQKFAASNHLTVISVYADRAVSGRTDRRAEFQKLMRDASKGLFRYVIAWKSSRLGRNMLEAMINDARLRELGVRTLYAEEDFDDTAAGRFALRNMMNVNQFYSENMAEDIRRGMHDNAEKCRVNGKVGYGFRKGEDGKYTIDPKEAAVVREIFERVSLSEPFVDIGADLNARGIKTASGGLWTKSSFQNLLLNERYRGVYLWGTTRVEGGIPRIVSDVLFYRVQEVLKTKKHVRGRHVAAGEYLLTGKLFCGHCGSPMIGLSGTSRNGDKYYYYVCQKKRTEKTCKKKNVRRDFLEQQVAEAIRSVIMQPEYVDWLLEGYEAFVADNRAHSLIQAYESELSDVNRALKNLVSAIEQGLVSQTTQERLSELEKQRRDLEIQIKLEQAATLDVTREQIEAWLKAFIKGEVDSRKYQEKLIDTFVHAVYLYDDELRIVCNYTGQASTVSVPFSEVDALGSSGSCSYKLYTGSPRRSRSLLRRFFVTDKNPLKKRGAGGAACRGTGKIAGAAFTEKARHDMIQR